MNLGDFDCLGYYIFIRDDIYENKLLYFFDNNWNDYEIIVFNYDYNFFNYGENKVFYFVFISNRLEIEI